MELKFEVTKLDAPRTKYKAHQVKLLNEPKPVQEDSFEHEGLFSSSPDLEEDSGTEEDFSEQSVILKVF